jgi:drug/metabolite transporter (DMT)-like permease
MLDDVSRVSSLIRISPLFLLILSFIFLGEVLSYKQYLGAILLISSALVVSYQKVKKKIHLSKGILLILFYAFGLAIMGIFTKYVLGNIDYWSFFFWNLIGNMLGCGVLISFPSIRKSLRKNISVMDRKLMLTILFVDVIAWSGYLLFYIAVSIGYVSLVSAIGSIQPMIVFIFTIAITIHKPHILKEEISKKSLLLKSLAVILIFIGSYLIVV